MTGPVVDNLKSLRSTLNQVILRTTPGPTVPQADFDELVRRRDRLTVALNQIIAAQFSASGAGLDAVVKQIDAGNKRLAAAGAGIAAVKTGLDVAGAVLSALPKVLTFVTA